MIDGETGLPFEKTAQGWNVTIGGSNVLAIIVSFE